MIKGVPVDILIDSGSTISLISFSLVKRLKCSQKPAYRILKGIGGQEIESTYRLSQAEKLRVCEIVEDLKGNGIIRESESEFASPILLVRLLSQTQRDHG